MNKKRKEEPPEDPSSLEEPSGSKIKNATEKCDARIILGYTQNNEPWLTDNIWKKLFG